MNQTTQLWMPAIPALFGSPMVVVITAWLNTKALSAKIEAVRADVQVVRAELKQHLAEAKLRIIKEILELKGRVERLEEQRGLIRQP